MRAVLFMVINNIKKRLFQSVIIITIMALTMMLLMSAVEIYANTSGLYDKAAANLKTSNALIYSDENYQEIEQAKEFWDKRDEYTANVISYQAYPGTIEFDGDKKAGGFNLELIPENPEQDKIKIEKSNGKNGPEKGEIWISTGYAYTYKIDLDSVLHFTVGGKKIDLKVTGIFEDPPFSVVIDGKNEAFISQDDWDSFKTGDIQNYVIKVLFNNEKDCDQMIEKWEDDAGKGFSGDIIRKSESKSQTSFQVNLSAMIMLLTAVILLIVIVIIISYSVESDIYSDFKNIGIIMSCGYNSLKVRAIYYIQYLILFFIAVPFSVLGAVGLTNWILNQFLLKSLGFEGIPIRWVSVMVPIIIGILLLILVSAYAVTKKAAKYKPVDIILMRNFDDKGKKASKRYCNIGSVSMITLKNIFRRKGQFLFIFSMAAAITFITLVIINLMRPMKSDSIFREYSGIGKEDVVLVYNPFKENAYDNVLDKLKNDDRVVDFYSDADVQLVLNKQNNVVKTNVLTKVLGDYSNKTNTPIKWGKNPENDDEIAVSTIIASLYNVDIGSKLKITIGSQTKELEIVGLFPTTENSGKVIRVSQSLMENSMPNFAMNRFTIQLKDKNLEDEFTDDYSEMDEYLYMISINQSIKNASDAVMNGVKSSVIAVNAILWTILLIVIFNAIMLNILRDKKVIGILSVIGFTSLKTKLTMLIPLIIESLMGIIFGIILIYTAGIPIMNNVYTFVGVKECPFSLKISDYLILTLIYIAFISITGYISTSGVNKVSPRDLLMEE
jgi:putative ABC transport system permease protein